MFLTTQRGSQGSLLTRDSTEQCSTQELQTSPLSPWYRYYEPCKVAFDFFVALCLLVLTAPLFAIVAALVRLTSRGPAIYSQVRLGKDGRPYTIYKIRTMVHNCERQTGPRWSTPNDARVTPVGRFLRISHLDELPQLWNVLRGDMSLVGPRPERPEFVAQLEQDIPHYRERMCVRPGVSGLAQVQLPADTDLESVRRKLLYDRYYVRRISPWLDLRVLGCTGCYLLGLPFRVSRRLLLLPNGEAVRRELQGHDPGPLPAAQVQTSSG